MTSLDPHVRVNVSLAQSWLLKLDELAQTDGVNRSKMIEALIAGELSRRVEQRLEEHSPEKVVQVLGAAPAVPVCSFCQRVPDDDERLIASEDESAICEQCTALLSWNPDALSSSVLRARACSFCGATRREARWLAQAPEDGAICSRCVEMCQRIFAEADA